MAGGAVVGHLYLPGLLHGAGEQGVRGAGVPGGPQGGQPPARLVIVPHLARWKVAGEQVSGWTGEQVDRLTAWL